jgi:hypothetical protein
MNEQETIADIAQKIRDAGFDELSDRLEAAHKRELSKNVSKNGADFGQLGDAAKLREALEKIRAIAKTFMDATQMRRVTDSARIDVGDIKDLADAALAAPPRNCDVGTVEEQSKRKMKFCYQQGGCSNCSFSKSATLTQCALAWAQMPYEEGGEE